jgi:hypothetical protein
MVPSPFQSASWLKVAILRRLRAASRNATSRLVAARPRMRRRSAGSIGCLLPSLERALKPSMVLRS